MQNIISGTVSNNLSGEPIPSVSVKEKGSNNATITNFDGKYSIEVPENAVIVFSALGFETQEKKFSENVLNISSLDTVLKKKIINETKIKISILHPKFEKSLSCDGKLIESVLKKSN